MKKYLIIRVFTLVAFFTALTAFMLPLYQDQEKFPSEKFSKLSIALKSKVYIEQGENYKLDIQADEKTLEKISVEYKADELEIKNKPASRIDEPVIIHITAPVLKGVSIAGSSELFIEKTFETKEIDFSIAGSGNMFINDLKADKVDASIAGSGNITLAGGKSGSTENISIAGSGKMDALEFKASKANIEIAGSGDCKVNVSETLIVSVAGSGNVYYKGKPLVKTETAGSGKVKPLDEE